MAEVKSERQKDLAGIGLREDLRDGWAITSPYRQSGRSVGAWFFSGLSRSVVRSGTYYGLIEVGARGSRS